MTAAPQKILLIRLGAMGDLIHVSPALSAIKATRPEAELHLLSAPLYAELAGLLPGVDRVWSWDKRQGWPALFRLGVDLKREGITHIANLHPSFKSWVLTRLIGAPHQRVYHKQKLSVQGIEQRGLSRRHAVLDFYEPVRQLLGLPEGEPADFQPVLPVVPDEGALKKSPPNAPILALIPGVGGKRANRAWPLESYRALIQQWRALYPAGRIRILGGPDEVALGEALRASFGEDEQVEDHCGRHGIVETARLLADCDLVIGGDTGPLHLAGAVGVPVIGIFGPTSVARTGPRSADMGKIITLTPPETLACWPCEAPTCPLSGEEHLACMRDIPVGAVLAASRAVLSSS